MDDKKVDKALHAPILSHVQELYSFAKYRKSPFERLRASGPAQAIISAVLFCWRGAVSLIWDVILSPSTYLSDPAQSLAILVVYPLFGTVIFLLGIVFALGRIGGYGDSLIDYISDRWAKGYSIVNWANPDLFTELAPSIDEAQAYLDGSKPTTDYQDWPLDPMAPVRESTLVRTIPLPLVRAFLAFNALVYERKDQLVIQAKEVVSTAYQAFGDTSDAFYEQLENAAQKLVLSESTIAAQAAAWGLRFEGVSDLNSVAGSFAGLFFSEPGSLKPFIVLTFKGTGPTAFAEWLTDCTLDRTSATSVLGGGGAHTGFFESLFRSPRRDYESNGYDTILRAVKQVAKALKRDDKTKVQLWVTGHSLGGAYAELAFMRLLASPADLGADLELRDCYTYGAPRPGDGQLASEYEKMSLTPLERPNSLWRVKNRLDLVTRVPLGIADDEDRRDALTPLDVLNYAHLGPALRLNKPLKSGQGRFSIEFLGRLKGASHVQIVEEGGAVMPWGISALDTALKQPTSTSMSSHGSHGSSSSATVIVSDEGINPVQVGMKVFATLLPCVWNHFPASYLNSLGNPHSNNNKGSRS
ncbi:hypothetical protein JCM9279_004665 [Rhodotorula babjevae]